jgi:hypothetical protein
MSLKLTKVILFGCYLPMPTKKPFSQLLASGLDVFDRFFSWIYLYGVQECTKVGDTLFIQSFLIHIAQAEAVRKLVPRSSVVTIVCWT